MQRLSETTITSQMQNDLTKLIETKITHVTGGRKAKANSMLNVRFKVATEFLHSFMERYDITVYSELKARDFTEAREYILGWQPPYNLKLDIIKLNSEERSF